ncbi:MAG: amidohydrolase family protein [Spirochaetota bacterium]
MIIDAYAHIGFPRYGTPEQLISIWRQWGIEKGCIALPPGMPDFAGLGRARTALGEDVRLFGIPYGADEALRRELAEIQIRFGIAGMRLMPREMLENPQVLAALGDAGLCLMAINVYESTELIRTMIDWLENYPRGTIAAPHFLRTSSIDGDACRPGVADPAAFRDLLRHPRMHAIFSRHGGASAQPDPHDDLRPWVDDVLPLLSWDRVMWGSEIPVIYHRDEQVDQARDWLVRLGVSMDAAEESAYLSGNAERLFFSRPAPTAEDVTFPSWVDAGLSGFIEANGPVPVIRSRPLELPLDLHGRLMSDYVAWQFDHPEASFQEWLVAELPERFGQGRSRENPARGSG